MSDSYQQLQDRMRERVAAMDPKVVAEARERIRKAREERAQKRGA